MMMYQGRTLSRGHALRAFSLAEVVCVVAIIGIFAAMAVPRLSNSLALQRVEAAARRIVLDLALAQRRATTASVNQQVNFIVDQNRYILVGMPHPDHPALEYDVPLAGAPYGATIVSADFNGRTAIKFDVYGIPDDAGSVVIRVGKHVRTVTVNGDTGKASVP